MTIKVPLIFESTFSFLKGLNDIHPDHGGKTAFPLQGMSFTPSRGTTLIWPAGYTHPHHAYPALTGDTPKYIITGWFEYSCAPIK